MKLLTQSKSGWRYQLSRVEAQALRSLIRLFPTTANVAVRITHTDTDPKTAEREKLLNDSLTEHREELRRRAQHLIAGDRLKLWRDRYVLSLGLDDREILLQILNDIRVESWRALGQPEDLDPLPNPSESERVHHTRMSLAGYFECTLLNLEETGKAATEQ
jgi:hypothetical protein